MYICILYYNDAIWNVENYMGMIAPLEFFFTLSPGRHLIGGGGQKIGNSPRAEIYVGQSIFGG